MKVEDGTSSLSSWMKVEDGTTSLSPWMKDEDGTSSLSSMTEGKIPCSVIFLEGLPKMEVSPSLVRGRLGLDEIDVGVLVGSR